jgi:hypothetical protein
MRVVISTALVLLAALIASCASHRNGRILDGGESPVQLRSFQSRAFDTTDVQKTLRTVIGTLQDLGFVIDKADATLGSISGTKLAGYEIRMTVTVRPRGSTQLLIRANAQLKLGMSGRPIDEPAPYQDFFTALGKAMFLTAQQVD